MAFDELTEYLLHDRNHSKISPEMLEMMGKQAANYFMEEGVALNEGIAKLAGVYPDVTGEQVKRICEFANTAVYLALHDQSKTASAESSYPQFDLADAGRVLQDLTDGARPTKLTRTDVEYGKLPQKMKVAEATADTLLADMFGVGKSIEDLPFTKTAAVEEIVDSKHDLQSLKDSLVHTGERFDLLLKEANAGYYETVKRHILDGGSVSDVLRAADEVLPKEKVSAVLRPFVAELVRERVISPKPEQLEKTAHRTVDPEHPLITGLGAIVSFQQEMDKIAVSLTDVDIELSQVEKLLKEQTYAHAVS